MGFVGVFCHVSFFVVNVHLFACLIKDCLAFLLLFIYLFFKKQLSCFIYLHWCSGTKKWSVPDVFPRHVHAVLVPMPGHLPRFLAFSCYKIGVFNPWCVLILRSIASFHVSYHHTHQASTKVFSRWLSMQHNTPEQWNGLMENKGKSLRLCHISKPSGSCRSGKQMLNSGKPSYRPLLSESLGEKWTNTLLVFLNIAELLRINVLKMIPWKNSEYNRHIFVGTNSLAWGTIHFLMTSSLISTY